MNFDQVPPQKLLDFLEGVHKELEGEVVALRDQFYDAVNKDERARAKILLMELIHKRGEYMEVALEYYGAKDYCAALRMIMEETKDMPKN